MIHKVFPVAPTNTIIIIIAFTHILFTRMFRVTISIIFIIIITMASALTTRGARILVLLPFYPTFVAELISTSTQSTMPLYNRNFFIRKKKNTSVKLKEKKYIFLGNNIQVFKMALNMYIYIYIPASHVVATMRKFNHVPTLDTLTPLIVVCQRL